MFTLLTWFTLFTLMTWFKLLTWFTLFTLLTWFKLLTWLTLLTWFIMFPLLTLFILFKLIYAVKNGMNACLFILLGKVGTLLEAANERPIKMLECSGWMDSP